MAKRLKEQGSKGLTRREALVRGGALLGAGLAASAVGAGPARAAEAGGAAPEGQPFGYCLNTSTIRGHKLGLVEELELAAKAGYGGVELWVHEIDEYLKGGGSLPDLGKRIRDLGLSIPSAIDFPEWMVEDPARRARALEAVKRRGEQLTQIGCRHMAAPPAGNVKGVDLLAAAERYRELLEAGEKVGVIPAVELWGFAETLNRLGQVVLVAVESKHPRACMVPDVYHLHRGGSGLSGVRHLSGASIAVFHVNDYPAQPPAPQLKDSHRVFPGDGSAPLRTLFQDLRAIGYRGMLSLELFNQDYYRRPALEVAREGLEKTKAQVQASAG